MFIELNKTGKNRQNVYVRLVEAYRDEEGRVRKKIIRNFGRLSDLERDDPDALARLKARYCADRRQKARERAENSVRKYREAMAPADAGSGRGTATPLLDYGHYPFRKIWNAALGLDKYLRSLSRTHERPYDVNAVLQYLAFHTLVHGSSISGAWADRDGFLGDPLRGVGPDQCLDACAWLHENHDRVFAFVNRKMDAAHGDGRTALVFYDAAALPAPRMADTRREAADGDFAAVIRRRIRVMREDGRLGGECFDGDGAIVPAGLPDWFWEDLEREEPACRRMGLPSEGGHPGVAPVLVMDGDGFPMDVVHADDGGDPRSVRRAVDALRGRYRIGEVVAFSGGEWDGPLFHAAMDGGASGLLAAQDVARLDGFAAEAMLDMTRYAAFDAADPESERYQTVPGWTREGADGSRTTGTLLLTYHEGCRRRDEAALDLWAGIVRAKQAAGVKAGPRPPAWAALALTRDDAEGTVLGVDEREYARRRRLCGFAAAFFGAPSGSGGVPPQAVDGRRLLAAWRRLGETADCFRMLLRRRGLLPVRGRAGRDVRAHVDACVLGLMVADVMRRRLDGAGCHLSHADVIRALGGMHVAVLRDGGDCVCLPVAPRVAVGAGHGRPRNGAAADLPREGRHNRRAVMEACGLRPLPRACSRGLLAQCLGTVFHGDEDMLPGHAAPAAGVPAAE